MRRRHYNVPDSDDAIVAMISNILKANAGTVYMPNPKRIREIGLAISTLRTAFEEFADDAEYVIEENPLTKSGIALMIRGTVLEIDDMQTFVSGIKSASNFCINALSNGKVEIGIMFYDAYVPVGKL